MRILYVEDNIANVSLVKRVARNDNLINYVEGEEALKNFDKDAPDLVLMDIQLAGRMTGLDVVKALRAEGHTLPIIAVTAYAMVGDRERCLAAGCSDYIAKPLPIAQLVELFEQRRREIAITPTAATKLDMRQSAKVVEAPSAPESAKPEAEAPVAPPTTTPVDMPESVAKEDAAVSNEPTPETIRPTTLATPAPTAITPASPSAVVPATTDTPTQPTDDSEGASQSEATKTTPESTGADKTDSNHASLRT